MHFTIYQASHIGGRKANQDRAGYAYTGEALLMVLADGMGGHGHGELAAQTAVQTLLDAFAATAQPRIPLPEAFLREGLQHAHEAILAAVQAGKLEGSPGTTCVAVLVQDGQAYWLHAGDSRFYLLRGREIVAVTQDDSLVRQWVEWGIISAADMKTHPARNRITNCLGGDDMFSLGSVQSQLLQNDDLLLLCSDGLWGPLSDLEIGAAFSVAAPQPALDRLIGEALQREGHRSDNVTAIAARWGAEEPLQHAESVVLALAATE
ncbi:MAG: PP2C family serine/threonine-protein phosphatase [Pseudomonadota bacterium]